MGNLSQLFIGQNLRVVVNRLVASSLYALSVGNSDRDLELIGHKFVVYLVVYACGIVLSNGVYFCSRCLLL